MIKRAVAVVFLAAGFLVPTVAVAQAAHSRADTLAPGQVLRWSGAHSEMRSTNGRFTVVMQPYGFDIDGGTDFGGGTVWSRHGRYRGPEDRTHLSMQRDGNLVLRHGNGDLIWQTGTHRAGSRLQIQDDGNLVLRSTSGHLLWQSDTTNTYMQSGDSLRSGARLILHGGSGFPTVRLIMHTNGDLVLSANGKLRWHSDTHVAGSSAVMTASGELAILGPHGNVRWHTPAFGKQAYLHITQDARVVVTSYRSTTCWQHPAPTPGNDCFSG